jgi:hypothetical protein
MNQQRARRFRAAKEKREGSEQMRLRRELLEQQGKTTLPTGDGGFDSNCITPGTEFMARLSLALEWYVLDRLDSDPGWSGVLAVLSDATIPGEGEHKIMDFIREQRKCPEHNPNLRHVLYGADADLIMLGLASHEPNFTILREEFHRPPKRPCALCGRRGCRPARYAQFNHRDQPITYWLVVLKIICTAGPVCMDLKVAMFNAATTEHQHSPHHHHLLLPWPPPLTTPLATNISYTITHQHCHGPHLHPYITPTFDQPGVLGYPPGGFRKALGRGGSQQSQEVAFVSSSFFSRCFASTSHVNSFQVRDHPAETTLQRPPCRDHPAETTLQRPPCRDHPAET